jgi:LysM repeat protein
MRGVYSLSRGLLISLIIAATVFGAFVLSVRGSSNLLAELPMPTVTLELVFVSPTPTAISQMPPVVASAFSPTPTGTPSPTPTTCPLPADWQRYIVGPFDTLPLLAQRFNASPDQLTQVNCLAQPSITIGQAIYVPGFRPTLTLVPCYPPFNWAIYIVQPGDSLSGIAQRYGMSLYTLMRANCLTTGYIYAGQSLFVPPFYPIVTFTSTPIIPTFTPTPTPIDSLTPTATATPPADVTLTPTLPPTDTPTPPITITIGPSETPPPTPTVTPISSDTPVPTNTATPVPTDTPQPTDTLVPTGSPPNTPEPPPNTPEPPSTVTP